MSKNNGLLDLSILENAGKDEVLDLPINEEADVSVPVPGGLKESAPGQPADQTISVPAKKDITADVYNAALANLKKSFKEAVEVMEMLENVTVVQKTPEQIQTDFAESAIDEAVLAAYEDGPVFEAVERSDKNEVKKIVRKLREKIKDELNDMDVLFYQPKLVARILTGLIPYTSANLPAAIQQIWSTRLWQVLGICHAEEGNIGKLANKLTEKFKDELGDYKVLQFQCAPALYDIFKMKFGWKNQKNCYFLLIDRKIPDDLKDLNQKLASAVKEEKNGKDDKKD